MPGPTPSFQRIPVRWLLLDLLGMALLGTGFAAMLGKLESFPASYGPFLVITGVGFMLPLFWQIRQAVRRVRQQDEAWLQQLPPDLAEALRKRKP